MIYETGVALETEATSLMAEQLNKGLKSGITYILMCELHLVK